MTTRSTPPQGPNAMTMVACRTKSRHLAYFLTPWALASLGLVACSDGTNSPGGGTTGTAGGQATSTAAGTTATGSGGSTSSSSGSAGSTSSTSTGGGSTGSSGATGSGGAAGSGGASGGSAGGGGSQAGSSGGTGGTTMTGDASDNLDAGGRRDASSDASGGSDASRSDAGARPARVLLYSFSTLTIGTVPAQIAGFKQKLEGWQYQVDESKDPAVFTDASLAKYAAVGMINTCFYPFGANKAGAAESQALQKFVQQGGGLFGTHCADVTFQSVTPPPLYNQLIGGRAGSDNFDGESDCRKMGDHPTIAALPATFKFTGNLDNAEFVATDSTVLVKCKWSGGGAKDTAVSWVRTEGAGRVFYTNFAKEASDLTNATFGEAHIMSGLGWVLGR